MVSTSVLSNALTLKQDNLTAGTNITISGDVISVIDVATISDLSNALEIKQDNLTPGVNINISGDVISIHSDVITENELNNSLELKQNKLIAGNNISISGDVISSMVGDSSIFTSYQNHYYYDNTPLGIGTKDICNNYALTISGGLYIIGTQTQHDVKIEEGNITTSGNVIVGGELTISGETLHNIIDNKISESSTGQSVNQNTEGSIVNVVYRKYDKFVTSNIGIWTDIDEDIVNGYVVSLKPTSANSKLMIQCNMHISTNMTNESQWWGAKLYRKIGTGNWEEVVGATNNQTASRPTGTGVFLSSQHQYTNRDIQNVSNSYVDDAYDNTSIHYYTIYWKCTLSGTTDGKNICINRGYESPNINDALPISSLILREIYYP